MAIVVTVGGVLALFETNSVAAEKEQRRAAVLAEAVHIAERIQEAALHNAEALEAFSVHVGLHPDIDRAEFEAYARRTFLKRPEFKLVAVAPDLVIRDVFPHEGNQAAIGLDYKKTPDQLAAVMRAVESSETVIAGPVQLVQGGSALIARRAVHTTKYGGFGSDLWGIVNLVLDIDYIFDAAGALNPDYQLAIRGKDGSGPTGDTILGHPSVFAQDAITVDIALPDGSWRLAMLPKDGWDLPLSYVMPMRLIFLAVGAALLALGLGGLRLLQLNMRANSMLGAAIHSIEDGFAYYDADDRLVICNEMYRQYYSKMADIIRPGRKFETMMREGLARGQFSCEPGQEETFLKERMRARRKGGGVVEQRLDDGRWLKIAESRTPDGGYVGFRVDITELKNAQETAERANIAKSEFLDVMSHELRTPLTVVLGGTPFLCKPELLPAAQKMFRTLENEAAEMPEVKEDVEALLGSLKNLAGKVERSAKHLLTLINDVLDYSKIEAGRMNLRVEPLDTSEIVGELLEEFRAKAEAKGLTLTGEAHAQMIMADRYRLRQVFINIIGNALKFTETGGITISSDVVNAHVRIKITDTGCGISEDRLDAVFEKFTQGDSSSSRKAGGTGLGMAISKKIVELLGGTIEVESRVGEGTSFIFTMPKASAADLTAAEEGMGYAAKAVG